MTRPPVRPDISDWQIASTMTRPEQPTIEFPQPTLTLPTRPENRPLRWLSASAIDAMMCPENYRRSRILKHTFTATGTMMVGNAVDQTLGYFLDQHRDGTDVNDYELANIYRARWEALLAERDADPDTITAGGPNRTTVTYQQVYQQGWACVASYLQHRFPALRADGWTPIETQKTFQIKFADGYDWGIVGDIDVVWENERDGRLRISDYKVRTRAMANKDAQQSFQADIYLWAMRELGTPATEFVFESFHRMLGPRAEKGFDICDRERNVGHTFLTVRRTDQDFQRRLYQVEHAARQIALYMNGDIDPAQIATDVTALLSPHLNDQEDPTTMIEAAIRAASGKGWGPHTPWPMIGFQVPGHWKCGYCDFYADCPAGGLFYGKARPDAPNGN